MDSNKNNSLGDLIQLVSFYLGAEEYGIDILRVQEINRMVEITLLPQAPDYCEGVINLRGRVIPIIDLRRKFGMAAADRDKNTRIIVCDIHAHVIGMIVDAVSEVRRIPASTVEKPPEIVLNGSSKYIRGVAKLEKSLLMFLDIEKLAVELNDEVSLLEEASV
ncbi:MAG: chemotaxis protein CheW [Candidatus Zixiibacteriota bacterium]